jgi:signal transduction histidine kinase
MGSDEDRRADRDVTAVEARGAIFDRWFAWIRVAAVPLAVAKTGFWHAEYPPGHGVAAAVATAAFAVAAVLLLIAFRRSPSARVRNRLAIAALAVDAAFVGGYVFVFAFENGQPLWSLYLVPLIEAALRFGLVTGLALAAGNTLLLALAELFRADRFEPNEFRLGAVVIRVALGFVVSALVGRLVDDLVKQRATAEARAGEAERLRDELGRRVDLLEAANRCARALASSLDLDQAFSAFKRELRGLVPFERASIVLAEGPATAQVIATAGEGAASVFASGMVRVAPGSVVERVLQGEVVYREDMTDRRYPEEEALVALGLRCRIAAPLLVGPRAVGMLSVSRRQAQSFTPEDVEFVALLGRLVATAVQNIRAYESERKTVEELRRLSALRADFVSLVSHELRSPMAAVIGAARTLQQRWRELRPEHREGFLALIADETSRLADLIGDVLDTSRIEAGTFSYVFTDVDLGTLVRETVATAALGQDEVRVEASVDEPLPSIRGDRNRLRQVLTNLIENAVKYSPAGEQVDVAAFVENGAVRVDVADRGPGVPVDQQAVIFEKFGRAHAGGGKPGTGLGLFIARSIVEAHGGALDVRSQPDRGSVFTLTLPVA